MRVGYTSGVTFEYKAWDRPAGHAGDRRVDTTGVLNSFSTQKKTVGIDAAP